MRQEIQARQSGSLAQLITSSLQLSIMHFTVSGLESFPMPVTRGTGDEYLQNRAVHYRLEYTGLIYVAEKRLVIVSKSKSASGLRNTVFDLGKRNMT